MPRSTNSVGTTTKIAVWQMNNTKTPTLSRSSCGLNNTSPCRNGSAGAGLIGAAGTTHITTAIPQSDRNAVIQNKPDRPTTATSGGAPINETANVMPTMPPTIAIALVRTSSRVESAMNADTAALTAPAPCSARPTMTPVMVVDMAATTLPITSKARPRMITGLRPNRSDAAPNGN